MVGLVAQAGLIDPTLVAVDGTKVPGDASPSRNQTLGELRERFAGWADEVETNDAAEDAAEAADPDGGPVEEMFDRSTMRQWIQRRLRDVRASRRRQMNVTERLGGAAPPVVVCAGLQPQPRPWPAESSWSASPLPRSTILVPM